MTCYDLQLRRYGILVTREFDEKVNDFIDRRIKPTDFSFHLNDTICLDRNVVLKDFFILLAMDIDLFAGISGCPFLDKLIEEALVHIPNNKEYKDGMAALELRQDMVVENEDGKLYVYRHFDFYGIGKDIYGIEFTPIYEFVNYPIFLNENLEIKSSVVDGGPKYLIAKMKFKLKDLVCGIIDELSFMGPPEARAAELVELKRRVNEVNDEAELVELDLDEMERKIEERREKHKKPCRICRKDARSCHFNKPPDLCIRCFKKLKEN